MQYNDIGIDSMVDRARIRKLLMAEQSPKHAHAYKFGTYILLPGMILFLVFFITLIAVQISAFAKGKTPYPKWCWIFPWRLAC